MASTLQDLAYILPLPIIAILIIIIGIIIFCVMRRARYGYFCCLKPRVIHLPDPPSSENSDGNEEVESGTSPQDGTGGTSQAPNYSIHPNSTIAPPDYQDALQDVLVVGGDDPDQPPTYAVNEDSENNANEIPEATNTGTVVDQEASIIAEPEAGSHQQQNWEDVNLDNDDNPENYDDTTPLNP